MPERAPTPRWLRGLLRLCLLAWPADRRRSHGASLLEATEASLADARAADAAAPNTSAKGRLRFLADVAGEAYAIVAEGIAMRLSGSPTDFASELRLALRTLLRAPGFTLVVVTTLALGIGANTAVFGLVKGVLLADPPYDRPEELLLVWNTAQDSRERIPVAAPDVAVLRERAERLAGVAFLTRAVDGAVESDAGDAAEHVRISAVTPDLFDVLGAEAALGRTFGPGDVSPPAGDPSGEDPVTVTVLAHGTWRRLFGSDPSVVGRTIRLNGLPVRVIGVMPADFRLVLPPEAAVGTEVDLWTPLLVPLASFHREERLLDQDSDNSGAAIARVAPGATIGGAREEVERIGERLADEVAATTDARLGLEARPLHADATAHARGVLLALLGAAATVLVVACLNVAGLVVARGAARADELAVRVALGAGRRHLLRQVLAESLVLVVLGLSGALVLAGLAAEALSRIVPASLAVRAAPTLDLPTLGVAVAAASMAMILAGLLPARRVAALGDGGPTRAGLIGSRRGRTGSATRTRRVLVVGEVALSVVLLLGAGLLLRTVTALGDVRPGFEPRSAVTFDVSLRVPDRYRSPGRRAELMKAVETRLRELPGVRSVGWVGVLPLSGDRWTQPWGRSGEPVEAWRSNRADFRVASSGWFEAMGARIVQGRSFTAREDLYEDQRVVVVDETLARRIAPDGSAVGAVIGVPMDGAPVEARIVGVVEPIRYETLESEGREAIYVPYRQEASRDVSFVVRTAGDPAELAAGIRSAVREVDPAVPVHGLSTLEAYVADALAPRRFALRLLALFAALGLACSAVGLYGVVAYEVSRRTRDIGIRMAVGADPGRTVRGVLGWGMRLAGAGLFLGAALALGAVRVLRSLVFGVGVADPPTWLGVAALVAAVTVLATWLPARRASRLDPSEALRGG